MRFRAEQRLRRQQDFRTARERGRRIDCGGFTLWYVRREPAQEISPTADALVPAVQPTQPRVGVVASTAAVGNAVRRNRAKRRLRAIFRKNQQLVPSDVDLLMVAKNPVNRVEFSELEKKFVEACRRVFSAQS